MQFTINHNKLSLFAIPEEHFKPFSDWDFFHSKSDVLFKW